MFTVCPKCALTLVVTAADLRVAQGYVRCGRCLNVFNALARLSEERPSATPAAPSDPTPAGSPQSPADAPQPSAPSSEIEEISEDTGEIDVELDASLFVTATRPPMPQEAAEPSELQSHSPEPAAIAAASDPGASAASTVAPATPSAPATPADAAAPPGAAVPAAAVSQELTKTGAASAAAPRDPMVKPAPQAQPEPAVPEQKADAPSPLPAPDAAQTNTVQQPPPESTFEPKARRPRAGLVWTLGAGALVLVLALQIVNHYRDALAANPGLRGPLSSVYSALGVKLAPHWNIHAYDVRQLGASVAGAAAGEIVVRASVKNSASRAQPLPLLRVTLQDRFGNRIAARDVPPGDYLPSPVAPGSLLAAGSRVDATMTFVDPGPQAVGFEIDACLPRSNGDVACAHGP